MDFLPDAIQQYSDTHTTEANLLLCQIEAETLASVAMPRMISGHYQGRILAMFCAMIQPKLILEIGTYTGYSALCMVENLQKNGKIITIDKNFEIENKVKNYFLQSAFAPQIEYILGDAIQIIPTLPYTDYDLVFIDADKINYANYYDLIFDKVKKGGFIIADNVLWSGKVADNTIKIDKKTAAIMAFNKKIQSDNRVENVLFALRDGLMVVRKL